MNLDKISRVTSIIIGLIIDWSNKCLLVTYNTCILKHKEIIEQLENKFSTL